MGRLCRPRHTRPPCGRRLRRRAERSRGGRAMRSRWLGPLALSLGLLSAGARAGERPTAQIDAPVPLTPPPPIFDTDPAPRAPVARGASPDAARAVPAGVITTATSNTMYQWRRPDEAAPSAPPTAPPPPPPPAPA